MEMVDGQVPLKVRLHNAANKVQARKLLKCYLRNLHKQ